MTFLVLIFVGLYRVIHLLTKRARVTASGIALQYLYSFNRIIITNIIVNASI